MTRISDLVPNEKVLGATVDLLLAERNTLTTSDLAARGPEVDLVAAGGPRKASVPFLNPLATDAVNDSNDDLTDMGEIGNLTADEYTVLRHDKNYGWGYTDLARMVTRYAIDGGIARGLEAYWNNIETQVAVASIKGAVNANTNADPEGTAEYDLTFGNGTDEMSTDLLIDAAATGELYADQFDILFVSPKIRAKLQRMNAGNTFVPASDANLRFDTFAGYKLITTKAFGDQASVIARSGALSFGEGYPAEMLAIEIERVANGGNGGGGDILHSRRSFVAHPQGFNYTGPISPTYAQLASPSNWTLAVPTEMVGFRLITHAA